MNLLIAAIETYWADRTDYFVGGNMFLHFDPEDKRQTRGPDFFLVLDVEPRERKSWLVWFEGMRFPDVIIELLSDSTREVDKGEKKELYAHLFRTPEYYLYDPYSHEFIGYQLQGSDYHELAPDAEGRIASPITGLSLAVRDGWLRWLAPSGEPLPTPRELAEQKRQRAEQKRQRAEQKRQRAEQKRQRAEQERQRAEQAETLLAQYQRHFGELP